MTMPCHGVKEKGKERTEKRGGGVSVDSVMGVARYSTGSHGGAADSEAQALLGGGGENM
jgi:hypothetical protein